MKIKILTPISVLVIVQWLHACNGVCVSKEELWQNMYRLTANVDIFLRCNRDVKMKQLKIGARELILKLSKFEDGQDGFQYRFYRRKMTFDRAFRHCRRKHGDLFMPRTDDDFKLTFLLHQSAKYTRPKQDLTFFVGVKRAGQGTHFHYADEERADFTRTDFWEKGQPSNGDCVVMTKKRRLATAPCNDKMSFICEAPKELGLLDRGQLALGDEGYCDNKENFCNPLGMNFCCSNKNQCVRGDRCPCEGCTDHRKLFFDKGYKPAQDGCVYKRSDKKVTRKEADEQCRADGAELASPRSKKQDMVQKKIMALNHPKPFFWLQYNDKNVEGEFVDDFNVKVTYTHWNDTQPNNRWGKEDCVVNMKMDKWMDVPCTMAFRVLCQFCG